MPDQNQNLSSGWFGHPRGLFYLFFAELWERFSFYGMRSLLVLYMTKELVFSDTMSFGVYAAYMSLVYLTPLIGGMIAERLLGYRKAVLLGGTFIASGHFLLCIEQPLFFYTSLSLIIIGCGFFKPNISSLVGSLYQKEDIRRDAGFTIFYMGINVGSSSAPLLCAWVASVYGWHYGFSLAGIGMLTGLMFFYRGIKTQVFGQQGLIPDKEKYNKTTIGIRNGQLVTVLAILSVPVVALLIYYNHCQHYLVWIASIIIVVLLAYIYSTVNTQEKKRLLVVVYFTLLYLLFTAVFEQGGSSLTLFADRNVNLVGLDAAGTNSINGAFIVLLAVPLSALWTLLERKKSNPSSPFKLGAGLLLLGLGFVVFALGARRADELAKTPMLYLILGYFIQTVGELFLSPIGLSKMTELSPPKYISFILGVWFLGAYYGQFFAGKIAGLTTVTPGKTSLLASGWPGKVAAFISGLTPEISNTMGSGFQQLYAYVSVYAVFGVAAMLMGLIAILLAPLIKKIMGGIH